MHPDIMFWLSLAAKLIVTAGVVVAASMIAERIGALVGSLVATLPVSTGPAYVFLSMEHDTRFIADSAFVSFATNPAILVYSSIYVVLSQRFGLWLSLLPALTGWVVTTLVLERLVVSLGAAVLFNAILFAAALWVVRHFRTASMPQVAQRWYDVLLRAGLVAALIGTLLLLSRTLGPALAGALAVFPVVFTSMILILHPRVGGPATAAVIANGLFGLIGFSGALLVLHLAVQSLAAPTALTLALAICIAWNLLIFAIRKNPRSSR